MAMTWSFLLLAVVIGLALALDVTLVVQKFKGKLNDPDSVSATRR